MNGMNGMRGKIGTKSHGGPKRVRTGTTATSLDTCSTTPLLAGLARGARINRRRPFAGHRIVMVLHALPDLIAFTNALVSGGAKPRACTIFVKSYPYDRGAEVVESLRRAGFGVHGIDTLDERFLDRLDRAARRAGEPILVIEDGGYVVPLAVGTGHRILKRIVGAVEQTTRGMRHVTAALADSGDDAIPFPLLSLPGSQIKQRFEPPIIGRAVVDAIERRVPHRDIGALRATVLGLGSIGAEVARTLRARGALVTAFDDDPLRRLYATGHGLRVARSAVDAVNGAQLVVGCSGNRSIDARVIDALTHGAVLASASSELYEIDLAYLNQVARLVTPLSRDAWGLDPAAPHAGTRYVVAPDDRRVDVLADGFPVNFGSGMPDSAADLVMSLILVAAAELAGGALADRRGVIENVIDSLALEWDLVQRFLALNGC